MKKMHLILPSRRRVLGGLAATGLAAPFINQLVKPAWAQSERVVSYAGYGGNYGDTLQQVWFDRFTEETGIRVNTGTGAGLALAKLQMMNPAGAEWDIVDLTNAEYVAAMGGDLLLPMGADKVDTGKILPEYVKSHGFSYITYVYVLGYNTDLVADRPTGWTDFWDMEKYPTKRTLQAVVTAGTAVEVAMMADGVPAPEVYPVDMDRAFDSLERLGRDNAIFATSLQEPVQRIGSGETPLGGIYTGRAILANRQGAKIGYTMRQGIVSGSTLGVIKNSNHSDEAFELLNFIATRGDLAAECTMRTSYGVPHVDVESLLPADADDIRASLPSSPELLETGLVTDNEWWAANLATAANRFQEWQLS